MNQFFRKHDGKLKGLVLILMLTIPFFLYLAASYGTSFQVKLLLGLMAGNMLMIMKSG